MGKNERMIAAKAGIGLQKSESCSRLPRAGDRRTNRGNKLANPLMICAFS
ncbi:hypothetical protein AMK02_CH01471 [Rhizobium sp. N731]|nr:hypothetical protein AMK02_CH01471 [Rhizobium sp. N731]